MIIFNLLLGNEVARRRTVWCLTVTRFLSSGYRLCRVSNVLHVLPLPKKMPVDTVDFPCLLLAYSEIFNSCIKLNRVTLVGLESSSCLWITWCALVQRSDFLSFLFF